MANVSNVEYFSLNYVPRALSNKSVSVAVIFVDPSWTEGGVCTMSVQNDWQKKVLNIDHDADVEMLEALLKEIGNRLLPKIDRHAVISQLEDSLSNIIQVSPRRTCSKDLAREAVVMSWMPLASHLGEVRSVKVARFDDDHKEMLSIIGGFYSAMLSGRGALVLQKVLAEMTNHSQAHFAEEEGVLEATKYPRRVSHRRKHQKLLKQLKWFQQEITAGKFVSSVSVANFVDQCLVVHMQGIDQQYSKHLTANGIS
ncbi:MAG: bacteriohemerythrin [Candidatus Sulfotelmatobacter sp.]